MKDKISLYWFRRDLRLHDNHALHQALNSGFPVLPVFVFDSEILGKLTLKDDARVSFIYVTIEKLKEKLEKMGSSLLVFFGKPLELFQRLTMEYNVQAVFANRDYEPYARERDREVEVLLKSNGLEFRLFKDHVIFEENEVIKDNGDPYTVFTPFSKKWKGLLTRDDISFFPSEKRPEQFLKTKPFPLPGLKNLGFEDSSISVPPPENCKKIICNYEKNRNFPAVKGTTRLGVHLRFGTISIREVVSSALDWSETFLNELIWREFFSSVLWHFPRVTNQAFKPRYDFIMWRNNEQEFERWCRGETGYPLVDAGMRELNTTGFMHNRVRMVTAGFLTRLLLVDWRWGEAFFAEKLLDFELASNNGNWQWAAGSGCDAAPYFRIFNPETQQKKFDPEDRYVKRWVPEYTTSRYPEPMVEYKMARERALRVYKEGLR